MRMIRCLWALAFVLMTSAGLVSCKGCEAKPIPKTCTKLFDQCQLPKGPIGICHVTTCKPGQKKPCYACVSQH